MRNVLAIVLLLSASAADAQPAVNLIKERCADEWKGDFEMQAYCRGEQRKALKQYGVANNQSAGNETLHEIIEKCESEWNDNFGLNYEMVVYCYKSQLDAYRKLQEEDK